MTFLKKITLEFKCKVNIASYFKIWNGLVTSIPISIAEKDINTTTKA